MWSFVTDGNRLCVYWSIFNFCCKLRLLYAFRCLGVWITIDPKLPLVGDTVWFCAHAQVYWQAAQWNKV